MITFSFLGLFFRLNLKSNNDIREIAATGQTLDEFKSVVEKLRVKYEPIHKGEVLYDNEFEDSNDFNLKIPPWLCHSHIRIPPEEHIQRVSEKIKISEDPNTIKRIYLDEEGNEISRKRMKRLRRVKRRPDKPEGKHDRTGELCSQCFSPIVSCFTFSCFSDC